MRMRVLKLEIGTVQWLPKTTELMRLGTLKLVIYHYIMHDREFLLTFSFSKLHTDVEYMDNIELQKMADY